MCIFRSLTCFYCSNYDIRNGIKFDLLCFNYKNWCYYDGCNFVYFIYGFFNVWNIYYVFPLINFKCYFMLFWCYFVWILFDLWHLIAYWRKIKWVWTWLICNCKYIDIFGYHKYIYLSIIIALSFKWKWMIMIYELVINIILYKIFNGL